MSIENAIKDIITQKLESGIVEKLVSEELEKSIKSALNSLFGNYGDATKKIESKIKEVMIPQLEGYDYSKYILKLDEVLKEILLNTTLDNKNILTNFKDLMTDKEIPKEIKVSQIFDEYAEYVQKNIDTSDLEVCYDDEPSYEYVDLTLEVVEDEKRSWSKRSTATIVFECEKDDDMNIEIKISKWDDDKHWSIDFKANTEIHSLKYLDTFRLYIIKLVQNNSKLILDVMDDSCEIEPEEKPEAEYR